MNKKISTLASVILILSLVVCLFSGCDNKEDENSSLTVTDPEGITYLAIENQKGEIMAGVTGDDGKLYAAEIDENGNVLSDGNLYLVESYTGTLPYNDTTAVSIEQSQNTTYDFAKDVITDPEDTTANIPINNKEDKTTNKGNGTTNKKNDNTTTTSSAENETQKAMDLAEKYRKLFESGCYYIVFTSEEQGFEEPVTAAVKNGNIYMTTALEGMKCEMIYQKKKDAVYVVMTDYHVYCKMPSDTMNELDMSAFGQTEKATEITVSNVSIDGKDCKSVTYETASGDLTIYYFYEDNLVRMDQIDTDGYVGIMSISQVSSTVDDSLFELPKTYVPINLSNFDFGSDTTTGE